MFYTDKVRENITFTLHSAVKRDWEGNAAAVLVLQNPGRTSSSSVVISVSFCDAHIVWAQEPTT